MSDSAERLKQIVECFVHCNQALVKEDIAKQFKYEVGHAPDRAEVVSAIAHAPDAAELPRQFKPKRSSRSVERAVDNR